MDDDKMTILSEEEISKNPKYKKYLDYNSVDPFGFQKNICKTHYSSTFTNNPQFQDKNMAHLFEKYGSEVETYTADNCNIVTAVHSYLMFT